MDVNVLFIEGIKLMGIGVSTVFVVLSLFYFLIKILLVTFPSK